MNLVPDTAHAPSVSVVIPTHNRAGMLTEAIQSVLDQSLPADEILVVDINSTDETRSVLEAFKDVVTPLSVEKNGPSPARNRGIAAARGEYVAFLDDDDLWHPEKLRIQMAFLEANREVAMASADTVRLGEDIREIRPDRSYWIQGDLFPRLFMKSYVSTPTVIVRRDVFEAVGVFNESYLRVEDYDLWLRIAAARPTAHFQHPLAWVRKSPSRMSDDKIDLRRTAKKVLMEHYDPDRIPRRRLSRRMSDLELYCGREYLKLGDRDMAGRCFRAAVDWTPFRPRPYRYLLTGMFRGRSS
ncbi:MAG: glycosyltransferase [Deltaproteobacteria bacterium]|nr:glycosyltransferase [Candidatus Zymogenaceae bacterium]